MPLPAHLDADRWVAHLFSARAAAEGGIVRRKVRDVERIVGLPRFEREVARRGFQLLVNADQFIVVCNAQPVRRRV
ncbi:N-(5'-phosphoribosyl)anthranilate isomerase [Jannaschia sp. Os4]|uniref:N-(5'-phosphoribosyl)anthranilate isomerase n=1 Tax=Jannaschia sp. Os4 TaxID=2807617 RepID=UPI00193976FD|nr:N-(5'-phosphoribosyl)anthranilate isomerase [Jannaschia sp. Os4]MBM2577600.1 N-(5'-phosphoribosyl)anthranilate isomerase [Jannaschia sp. Os4]